MKLSYFFLLGISVLISGCNPIKGTLSVKSPMNILIPPDDTCDQNFDWWNCNPNAQNVVLEMGSYSLSLIFKSNDKLDLEIKLPDKTIKTLPISLESGEKFPEYSGHVKVLGKTIKQEFDILGIVDTKISYSDSRRDVESCQEQIRERVCTRVRDQEDKMKMGDKRKIERERRPDREVCEWKYVTHYGHKEVEYYYKYTQTDVDLTFVNTINSMELADYLGSKSDSDKIYTYEGRCIIRH